ncbi:hypothetical protein [Sulfurihydrogenibium sp.]|uniref:hypothetical protein n=1 Tax=Sulfurihydrogenibium sp. TaxID=2053621 RepID=UPI003D11CE66
MRKNEFVATFLFFLIFIFIILIGRSLYVQYKYMNLSHQQAGLEKIKSLEKVLLFYVPFSPYNDDAVNTMLEECQNLSKIDEKLYCYETLRTSLVQIRSFYQPYKKTLEQIIPVIADLRSIEMLNWDFNNYSKEDYKNLYISQLKLLTYDNQPSVFWSFVAVISLIGWILAIVLLIWKGLGERINKDYILVSFVLFLLFFGLWILGLYMA